MLLVLTVVPLQPWLHTILMLLRDLFHSSVWDIVRRSFWLNWAFRAMEKYTNYVLVVHERSKPYLLASIEAVCCGHWVAGDDTSGRVRALCFEQKVVVWKKFVAWKFKSFRQAVIKLCTLDFATNKACTLLPRHCRYLAAILTVFVSNKHYLGVWRCWQGKSSTTSHTKLWDRWVGFSKGLGFCYWQYRR